MFWLLRGHFSKLCMFELPRGHFSLFYFAPKITLEYTFWLPQGPNGMHFGFQEGTSAYIVRFLAFGRTFKRTMMCFGYHGATLACLFAPKIALQYTLWPPRGPYGMHFGSERGTSAYVAHVLAPREHLRVCSICFGSQRVI